MADKKHSNPSKKLIDISGQRFGKIVVISFYEMRKKNSYWLCKCDCGVEKPICKSNLLQGRQSCGCYTAEILSQIHGTHRMTKTPTYKSWIAAKNRCFRPSTVGFEYYGGRGITMCEKWAESFEAFYADMGDRPTGRSLERIDNSKNYEPGNCKWATPKEQVDNRRNSVRLTHKGETLLLTEWAQRLGIPERVLRGRRTTGYDIFAAYKPRKPYCKRH